METNKEIKGLSDAQVLESRKLHGENVLTPPVKESLWHSFLMKFKDPLIIILLIAGTCSIGISLYEYWGLNATGSVFFEPIGIFVAIILATGLAFYFEYKADREFAILNQVNDDEPVQVIRNDIPTTVPRRDIVVGDVILLTTGEEIPADARLIEATSLNVDESTLTGEPMAHKSTNPDDHDPEATFPTDMVMRGTKVMEGHGIAVVTAVGDATENGKVYEAAQIDDSVRTPLNEQLDGLGTLVSRISYGFGALIIVGRIVMYFVNMDFEWISFIAYLLQSIMISVTLVVVAAPEGLPMAVTLSLAYSMRRMLKTNNLVRKMHACETMGATTVICTDKTGTLTQNKMQVAEAVFESDGSSSDINQEALICENMAVNSTAMLDTTHPNAPQVMGNPTEGALLLWLRSRGVDYKEFRAKADVLAELPFSTERKYMATLVANSDGKTYLLVKGAPEIVMNLCTIVNDRVKYDELLRKYQSQAMRTLGFAVAETQGDTVNADLSNLASEQLRFQGVVAISDPVRIDVPLAIEEVLNAGIGVKIVTGDTPGTAREIGRQVGLWREGDGERQIVTGPEIGQMSDKELDLHSGDWKIIARARPMDKKRLVESLQRQNQVVAVTGDGTNDAPALKAAHVGLSMGDGTSVAKEASDITIIDNSFSSIGRAVMWGRSLFQNIQRFIMFQMTVNVAACFIVLAGAFLGMQSPLTVTQMLWVNLIMDTFAAMALASLPPSSSVMHSKPRDRATFIINRPMWGWIVGAGAIFFLILLWMVIVMENADITSMTDLLHPHWNVGQGLTDYEESLIFTSFVFLQFWNLFNARAFATSRSAIHLEHCGEFLFIVAAILGGQILIVEFGGEFFNVQPLQILDWVIIVGFSSLVLWIGEIIRLMKK